MAQFEVFLDQMPGETRGVVARDGHYHHLIIHRDTDRPCDRLGADLVGRVARLEPTLRGAFIDMGMGEPFGFLPLAQKDRLGEGAKIEIRVIAEPRETKGPVLKLIGPASGEPRLMRPGAQVSEILALLAPRAPVIEGVQAIRASLEAEEDALATVFEEAATGLNLAIERTRALISIDIDHRPTPGRDGRKAREAVNWAGLQHSARLLRLKGWAGLVVIDLVGVGLHGETVMKSVRAAFSAETDATYGPLSRFGLMQMSLPWRQRPIDDRVLIVPGRARLISRSLRLVREMRLALLTDLATPRLTLHASAEEVRVARPYIGQLGRRASVVTEPSFGPGQYSIKDA